MLFYRGRDRDVEKSIVAAGLVQAVRANAVFGASRIRRRTWRRALRYAPFLRKFLQRMKRDDETENNFSDDDTACS